MSRVVLGEDHGDLAFLLAMVLGAAGHRVETCTTGAEVLRACDPLPDLVLLDVHLHGPMDGLEVTRRLREVEAAAGSGASAVPVLLLSAGTPDGLREAGRRVGATDWLTKPFAVPELQARVELLLASRT